MNNLNKELSKIFRFFVLSYKSKFKFAQKLTVLRILLSTYWKHQFHKGNNEVTQNIFGFKVTAYSYDTLQFLFKEIFLQNEYYFETTTSQPKIIDCGANIGMSILYFKKMYPNCSITAFEPNPFAFKLLEKNVQQNNLTNVKLFNIGLSNTEGKLDFFIGENKGTLLGSFMSERGGGKKVEVSTQRLSSLMGTEELDLIKIDVEGAENLVLEDLVSTGKIHQGILYIVEYHHRINGLKSDFSQFLKQFEENGFDYNLRARFKDIGSFQDVSLYLYKDKVTSSSTTA